MSASGSTRRRRYDVPMWGIEQAARLWRFAASQGKGGADLAEFRPHRRGLGRRRNPQPQGRLSGFTAAPGGTDPASGASRRRVR